MHEDSHWPKGFGNHHPGIHLVPRKIPDSPVVKVTWCLPEVGVVRQLHAREEERGSDPIPSLLKCRQPRDRDIERSRARSPCRVTHVCIQTTCVGGKEGEKGGGEGQQGLYRLFRGESVRESMT